MLCCILSLLILIHVISMGIWIIRMLYFIDIASDEADPILNIFWIPIVNTMLIIRLVYRYLCGKL